MAAAVSTNLSTLQPRAENVLDVEHAHGRAAAVDHGELVDALLAEDPQGVRDEPVRPDRRGSPRHDGADPLLLALRVPAQQAAEVAVRENPREAPVRADDADGARPGLRDERDRLADLRLLPDDRIPVAGAHDVADFLELPAELAGRMEKRVVLLVEPARLLDRERERIAERKERRGRRRGGEPERARLLDAAELDDDVADLAQR